jgi:hypothetical protein
MGRSDMYYIQHYNVVTKESYYLAGVIEGGVPPGAQKKYIPIWNQSLDTCVYLETFDQAYVTKNWLKVFGYTKLEIKYEASTNPKD